MSAMLDAALAYARRGIPIFPCIPNSKKPATARGFHDATTDETAIRSWWQSGPDFNIAFSPQTIGQGVVDLDGQDGIDAWRAFAGDRDYKTYIIRTPRGGFHLYYEGELPTSVRRLIPGKPVDTRGKGSYALLPPSATPDGTYAVFLDRPVSPMPEFLTRRVALMRDQSVKLDGPVEWDTVTNLSRATAYLAGRNPAVEGRGGDEHTYQTACDLCDLGISEERAVTLMEVWNETCVPPWDMEELQGKIANAYRYAQNSAGSKVVEPAASMLAKIEAPIPKRVAGPVSFEDVIKRDVPAVQEIVPGLIERGIVTFLAGAGGSHKSRTALHWGLAIASGTPIYGRAVEQCDFLYLSYEDHPDEVARRSQAICRRLDIRHPDRAQFWDLTDNGAPLAIVSEAGVEEQPFCEQVRAHLKAMPGQKFVVLDSAYNVLAFIGAAKIDEALVKAGIEFLGRLGRECDATIIVLWHPSQAGQERGDASGWSVAWHNTPRARLSIGADKDEEGGYILKVEKRNNAARGEPIRLRWDAGLLSPPEPAAREESDSRVVEAMIEVVAEGERTGQFLQRSGKIMGWQQAMLRQAAPGRRITDNLIRETAANLERLGKLKYVSGKGHDHAGYRLVTDAKSA